MSNDINVKLATLQQAINITSNECSYNMASFRKEVKMISYQLLQGILQLSDCCYFFQM